MVRLESANTSVTRDSSEAADNESAADSDNGSPVTDLERRLSIEGLGRYSLT
jgi:hypothetical protein